MIAIVSPITSYFWEHFVMPIFGIKVELSNRTWRIPDMFINEYLQNIKNGGRTRGNIGVKYSLLFRFHFDFSMPSYRKR